MSLLSVCQQVARTVPVQAPTVIIGNTDETATLLLACAQKAGQSIARANNWVDLVKEHTFPTVASQADYDLPSDYRYLVNDTLWDRSNYWQMRGPLSPQQWQTYKSSVLGNTATTFKRFRIRDVSGTVKFSIDPTPTAVESLVFEYVSNAWCESSGGTAQTAWEADDDVFVLDEYLLELNILWRFLKRLGMDYADERDEYERELRLAIGRDGGSPVLRLGSGNGPSLITSCNVPDTGFGV